MTAAEIIARFNEKAKADASRGQASIVREIAAETGHSYDHVASVMVSHWLAQGVG